MGKDRVVNKDIGFNEAMDKVVKGLQSGSYSTAQIQQMFPGVIPMGDYKGYGALWDIDLAVKQPLVAAEQLHILGILDGRLEGHDLVTVTIPNGALANAVFRGSLVVPAGQVWFVTAVETVTPADDGGTPAINWACSLWTDPAATPDPAGQPFHAIPKSATPAGDTFLDEFHWTAMRDLAAVVETNKPVALRLPAGAVITAIATNLTLPATGDMDCTLALYGYIGRPLVG